jgi:hypothetical protein
MIRQYLRQAPGSGVTQFRAASTVYDGREAVSGTGKCAVVSLAGIITNSLKGHKFTHENIILIHYTTYVNISPLLNMKKDPSWALYSDWCG